MLDKNRWCACFLPDNYQRKLRQDLTEADAVADSGTRLEPEEGNEDDGGRRRCRA
jgi:hypothetical protein